MFLARRITHAKWRPREGFAEGEIAADAVTVESMNDQWNR